MATLGSFTYGGEKIGGSSPTHNTEVLDVFNFDTSQDVASFVCKFAVRVTPSGNAQTDFAALATACQAVELALRTRYQKLTIDWGASNQETFDPSVSAGTFPSSGFTQEPQLDKDSSFPNSGEARGYVFRVSMGQYPTYTDAYGAAAGRRQIEVSFHYDTDQRLTVVMHGQYSQVPSALARAQFLANFYGNTGYASYRLGLIDSTVPGASGDTWAITRRDESDPNDLSVLNFTVEFQQHLHGRRGSSLEIFYGQQRLRTVTIRGTYLRTITGTNFGTANDSQTNFLDSTNGGYAYAANTTLPGLVTAQGGPLTVGQTCELLQEPTVITNEQQDRTEHTLVFQELIQQQSVAAAPFLDDPNIVGDTIQVAVQFNEVNDSQAPPAASSVPGPGGSAALPSSGSGGGSGIPGGASGGTPATIEKVTNAPGAQQSGGNSPGGPSLVVQKPVDMFVSYEAFFNKDNVRNCYQYWRDEVLPLLLSTLVSQFSLTATELVDIREQTNLTKNSVSAALHVRAYNSSVIIFTFTQGIFNDLGIRADPAFTGTAHDYLVQQALPKTTMSRSIEAVYKAGQFSLDQFVTPPTMTGWVPLANSQPSTVTRFVGVPGLGVPSTNLTYAKLEENLLWVRSNVASSGGGQQPGNSTPTGIPQTVSPPPVAPAIATGQGTQ